MVDLDELDRLHASLPKLEAFAQSEVDGETVAIATVPYGKGTPFGEDVAAAAVAILNAWPEVSRELRERRANAPSGELAALRALAVVVKARCDMANPGWAPEIREALALVEKAKAP